MVDSAPLQILSEEFSVNLFMQSSTKRERDLKVKEAVKMGYSQQEDSYCVNDLCIQRPKYYHFQMFLGKLGSNYGHSENCMYTLDCKNKFQIQDEYSMVLLSFNNIFDDYINLGISKESEKDKNWHFNVKSQLKNCEKLANKSFENHLISNNIDVDVDAIVYHKKYKLLIHIAVHDNELLPVLIDDICK